MAQHSYQQEASTADNPSISSVARPLLLLSSLPRPQVALDLAEDAPPVADLVLCALAPAERRAAEADEPDQEPVRRGGHGRHGGDPGHGHEGPAGLDLHAESVHRAIEHALAAVDEGGRDYGEGREGEGADEGEDDGDEDKDAEEADEDDGQGREEDDACGDRADGEEGHHGLGASAGEVDDLVEGSGHGGDERDGDIGCADDEGRGDGVGDILQACHFSPRVSAHDDDDTPVLEWGFQNIPDPLLS